MTTTTTTTLTMSCHHHRRSFLDYSPGSIGSIVTALLGSHAVGGGENSTTNNNFVIGINNFQFQFQFVVIDIRGSSSIDLAVSKFSRENLFFKFRRARSRPSSRFRFFAQHLSFGGGGGCVDWSRIARAVVRFSGIGRFSYARNSKTKSTEAPDF